MYEININIYFLQSEWLKYILTVYFDGIDVNIRQYLEEKHITSNKQKSIA